MTRLARWDIDWGRVPRTLWAYVAVTGVTTVMLLTRSIHAKSAIFAVIFIVVWDYFLLRAVRWLWIVTTAFLALALAVDLATQGGTWWGDATGLLQLGLLVLPPTRRFFADSRA